MGIYDNAVVCARQQQPVPRLVQSRFYPAVTVADTHFIATVHELGFVYPVKLEGYQDMAVPIHQALPAVFFHHLRTGYRQPVCSVRMCSVSRCFTPAGLCNGYGYRRDPGRDFYGHPFVFHRPGWTAFCVPDITGNIYPGGSRSSGHEQQTKYKLFPCNVS